MGWDTVFERISAFATIGALAAGVGVGAGRQAKHLYQTESTRDEKSQDADRRREQVERKRQAAQVSAWAAMQIDVGGTPVFGVVVRNSSDDPICDVRAIWHGSAAADATLRTETGRTLALPVVYQTDSA